MSPLPISELHNPKALLFHCHDPDTPLNAQGLCCLITERPLPPSMDVKHISQGTSKMHHPVPSTITSIDLSGGET